MYTLHQFFSTGVHGASGSASGYQGFRRNRPKLPATAVLCDCSNTTVSQFRGVPWATQTFAEGSAAAKRLKNTALHLLRIFWCSAQYLVNSKPGPNRWTSLRNELKMTEEHQQTTTWCQHQISKLSVCNYC